ncbi:MAG: hypothetical protein RLZ98_1753 [Pseudomonadota bacterium]|jgi:isoquinoline 1-oxidoreductase beta subunit
MNDMSNKSIAVSRRGFLAGGLTFGLVVAAGGVRFLGEGEALANAGQAQFGAWVKIKPDNTITILTAGAEMGQGSMTSVPLMLAEELDADWSKVTLEWAPADVNTYGYSTTSAKSMAIVGSRAVMYYHDPMRIAGAQVRKVLLSAAAEKLGVAVNSLKTEPNTVVHPESGRKLSYGEIAAFAKVPAEMPSVDKSELKKKSEFRYIGKSQPRYDIPSKVNGTAEFSMDVLLPGMVYATALHSPVHGGAPESWNDDKIKSMKGVIATVGLGRGIAVVADTFEHALAARNALEVKWKDAKAAGFDSEKVLDIDYDRIQADPKAKVRPIEKVGDFTAAVSGAAKTYKQTYKSDYAYHAQMEPLNAVVRINADGGVDVWEGTQAPGRSRQSVAKALSVPEDKVNIRQCYMGGGFGRRSLGDVSAECAKIAKAVGKPVKLIWTREEDIAHGMFRPQSSHVIEAAQDKDGKVTGLRHTVVGDGRNLLTGGLKPFYYELANKQMELKGTSHGIRLKHWRAVAHPFILFAREQFIDEMAHEAKMDPLDFRMKNMALSDKGKAVFRKVAEMSDWGTKREPGRALGLAISERSGSLGAGVIEVSLDEKSGKVKAHKVWIAIDGGLVVQPDAAKANIESGIIWGLSSVLYERATIKGGSVQQSNFHDYQLLRMSDTPDELNIAFLDVDTKPTGLGEIGNPFVGPCIANALFQLTGKRFRHMPLTPERVLATLKA